MSAPPAHTTTTSELLAALACLPDGASLTITVSAGDLRAALTAREGGPSVLTCEAASLHLGKTPEFWRRLAADGKIAGAWQDAERGPWSLPRAACDAHLRALAARGRRRGTNGAASVTPLFDGGRARGPRRQHREA